MKKILLTTLLSAAVFCTAAAKKNKTEDRRLIDRVAAWQIEHFPEVKHNPLDWTNGALYRGLLEWADYTGDSKYYDFLMEIGEKAKWGFLRRVYHADDLCVGQMYVGMYRKFGRPEMIDQTRRRLDHLVWFPSTVPLWHGVKGGSDRWSWCDALFMAPPVFVEMYNVTGDEKYLQFLDREYKLSTDSLFSPEDGLFYRDRRFIGRQEPNGKKVFWGRGNGWVFGGLALILEHLPKDHYTYGYYLDLYRRMADAILPLQDEKGSWHASLYDPVAYPLAENSGSGFFVFGLAWGVNHKVLTDDRYKEAAVRGWEALKGYVDENGRLGSVQPIGAAPGKVRADMTEVYGVGAFLLAGKEMLELKY